MRVLGLDSAFGFRVKFAMQVEDGVRSGFRFFRFN